MLNGEPQMFQEAMSTPHAPYWKEAIDNEIDSILSNHTWELIDLPKGHKAIENKWVLKIKSKADRIIERYKAHLVAKGYT